MKRIIALSLSLILQLQSSHVSAESTPSTPPSSSSSFSSSSSSYAAIRSSGSSHSDYVRTAATPAAAASPSATAVAAACNCPKTTVRCDVPENKIYAAASDQANCILHLKRSTCVPLQIIDGEIINPVTYTPERPQRVDLILQFVLAECTLRHELSHMCDNPKLSHTCGSEEIAIGIDRACYQENWVRYCKKASLFPKESCNSITQMYHQKNVVQETVGCYCEYVPRNGTEKDIKSACDYCNQRCADQKTIPMAGCEALGTLYCGATKTFGAIPPTTNGSFAASVEQPDEWMTVQAATHTIFATAVDELEAGAIEAERNGEDVRKAPAE